jgi:Zn-dependent protease with chaperone function
MSFLLLGLALLLAIHLLVSTGLSLIVASAVSPRLARRAASDPARRARGYYGLAMLPGLGGLVASLGLALPAWLLHEPRDTGERAGPALLALAAGGALLLLVRFLGAGRDFLRTRRVIRSWMRRGKEMPGLSLPAVHFPHAFPLAGLAGLRHPRFLVADAVVRALERDELEAVVAHERAHAAARDNLRQLLLRASPDVLALTATGRRLRAQFEDAAEAAADQGACAQVAPLALARALLKVAALAPASGGRELGFATLHREGSLSSRVRALLRASEEGPIPPKIGSPARGGLGPALLVGAAALVTALLLGTDLLPTVHELLETLVHSLA